MKIIIRLTRHVTVCDVILSDTVKVKKKHFLTNLYYKSNKEIHKRKVLKKLLYKSIKNLAFSLILHETL